MKTISERAHEYGCKIAGGHYEGGFRGSLYQGNKDTYSKIATEQRDIDIEKATEWLKQELSKLAMNDIKDNFLDNEFKVVLESDIPIWIENFRKAILEQ